MVNTITYKTNNNQILIKENNFKYTNKDNDISIYCHDSYFII